MSRDWCTILDSSHLCLQLLRMWLARERENELGVVRVVHLLSIASLILRLLMLLKLFAVVVDERDEPGDDLLERSMLVFV